MKASLIISVYQNVDFLRITLESLRHQTETDFEIIISEDGCSPQMKSFIDSYPWVNPMIHLTQPDEGWRKNRALNRAIAASSAPQIIFIDGDVALHPRFIEHHVKHFAPGRLLTAKRFFLNQELTQELLAHPENAVHFRHNVMKAMVSPKGTSCPEEGIFVPGLNRVRKMRAPIGCNMSLAREDLVKLNGFDEEYTSPAYGEDTELLWRIRCIGGDIYSLRNQAVQYHFYHKPSYYNADENLAYGESKRKRGEWRAANGLDKWLNK